MEFADLGKHCAYCKQKDYLPFTCTFCSEAFCLKHRTQASHKCRVQRPQRALQSNPKAKRKHNKFKCLVSGCKRGSELNRTDCRACGGFYCLSHRFPGDHSCKGRSTPTAVPARELPETNATPCVRPSIPKTPAATCRQTEGAVQKGRTNLASCSRLVR